MTTIVPYMSKHEHRNMYWLAGNSSISEQRRCDQARDDENSICVQAHRNDLQPANDDINNLVQ